MTIPFSRKQMLIVVAVVAALIIAAVVFIRMRAGNESEAILEGRELLRSMESGDTAAVDDRLVQIEEEKMQQNLEAYRQALLNDPEAVWQQFTDFAIIGDSRAEGFKDYEFLPPERVLADKGQTIDYIYDEETVAALKTLQPTKVWIILGNNDIGNSENPDWLDWWIGEYTEAVRFLEDLLPNSMIIVCSVLPVIEPSASEPVFTHIPEVNEALKTMCEQNGFIYEDDGQILDGHPEYYEPDGMHFTGTFYSVWATSLLMCYYDHVGHLDAIKSGEETADETIRTDVAENEALADEEEYSDEEDYTDGTGEDESYDEEVYPETVYYDDYAGLFYHWDDEAQDYLYLEDWAQPYVYWDDATQQYLYVEPTA